MSTTPREGDGNDLRRDSVSYDSSEVKRTVRHISSGIWHMKKDSYDNKDRVYKILERNKEAREKARIAEEERAAAEAKVLAEQKKEEEENMMSMSASLIRENPPGAYQTGEDPTADADDGYQIGDDGDAYQEGNEEDEDGDDPMTASTEPDENGYVGGYNEGEENEGYQQGDDDEDEEEKSALTAYSEPKLPKASSTSSSTSTGLTSYDNLQGRGACDWSGRFTSLIEEIKNQRANTPFKRRIEVNEDLMRLSSDFLLSAELYGKTIISEMFLPLEEKTIKPAKTGGVAGGEKYIIRNILFKFALDVKGLYKGDANAAKAAGHELKGVMSFHNCFLKNFHLPLMAIIDYRGFRVVAMSLLPIKDGRLIYGSDDCGKTVHNDVPDFAEKMRIAGEKLNLAGHTVDNKLIYAAFDVEGHQAPDGRFYLLDLARTFPPELPLKDERLTWPQNAFLYRLLRPELVKKSPFPICSDAGTRIQQQDPEWKTYNKNARTLKAQLIREIIPTFAVRFVSIVEKAYSQFERQYHSRMNANKMSSSTDQPKTEGENTGTLIFGSNFPLKQYLHAEGINMRHMGYLMKAIREEVPDGTPGKQNAKALIFTEMAARTIRQETNAEFRLHMRLLGVPLEEPYRLLLMKYLNSAFGDSEKSTGYWNSLRKRLVEKFGELSFTEQELSEKFDLRALLCRHNGKTLLFLRLKKLMGFTFDEITENTAVTKPLFYEQPQPFDDIDLRAIGARVKHMAVVNHARGYIYKMRGSEIKATQPEKASVMLQKALQNFDEVLESNPTNFVTLRNCGQVMQIIETINSKRKDPNTTVLDLEIAGVSSAREFYMRAVDSSPKDTHSLYQLAQFLVKCDEKEAAEEYFLRSLEADPKHIAALVDFGVLLRDLGHPHFAKLVLDCVNEEEMKNIFRIDF